MDQSVPLRSSQLNFRVSDGDKGSIARYAEWKNKSVREYLEFLHRERINKKASGGLPRTTRIGPRSNQLTIRVDIATKTSFEVAAKQLQLTVGEYLLRLHTQHANSTPLNAESLSPREARLIVDVLNNNLSEDEILRKYNISISEYCRLASIAVRLLKVNGFVPNAQA
jgi:uncharacterized protein (DUF1778 family)